MKKFLISRFRSLWPSRNRVDDRSAVQQKVLALQYRTMLQEDSNPSLVSLNDTGFRIYSQHEEDGILLFIFSLIGSVNKRCVEIAAGDGSECNTANLILNHRWLGLLFDGNFDNIDKAKQFYSSHPDSKYWPPTIVHQWITKHNINTLVSSNGYRGEIDLLSLDVDGIDYWLWRELSVVSPRVVVLEFNHLWGPDTSVTVPYSDDFICEFTSLGSDYAGASLRAFVNLGKAKGYRLVGTNAIATNAFFIRNDIACPLLPEIDPRGCFGHPRACFGMEYRLARVRDKEWVEV